MKTMTGILAPGLKLAGVQTLSCRQSSDWLVSLGTARICQHCGPSLVASREPDHFAGACGGRQRRSPTGGAAKGMSLKLVTAPAVAPCSSPWATLTVSAAWAAVALRASVAAAAARRVRMRMWSSLDVPLYEWAVPLRAAGRVGRELSRGADARSSGVECGAGYRGLDFRVERRQVGFNDVGSWAGIIAKG